MPPAPVLQIVWRDDLLHASAHPRRTVLLANDICVGRPVWRGITKSHLADDLGGCMAYWQQEGGVRRQSGRGVGITNYTAAPWWYLVAVWVGSRRPPLYKRHAKRRSV